VEVQQVEAVAHAVVAEEVEGLDHFGDEQAELRSHAAGLFPAAAATRGELHAHADAGLDVVGLGVLDDQFELAELFDDGDYIAADLGGEDDGLDELVVLEAVADDRRVVVVDDRHDGEQLGLAAGFEAEAELFAEVVDLFDHVPLLVDLDGVDAAVAAVVVVVANGVLERLVQPLHTVLQDVGEADEAGELDVALAQLVDELFEVDVLLRVLPRVDGDVAVVVDAEVTLAPVGDAVDLGRLGGRPGAWLGAIGGAGAQRGWVHGVDRWGGQQVFIAATGLGRQFHDAGVPRRLSAALASCGRRTFGA
jgi:hypothetical protein